MNQTKKKVTRSYGLNDPSSMIVDEWPQSKRDLYDAARELFWTKGFLEASVQEIVGRAGLTKGAFYHYFDSKDDVLKIMFERSLIRLMRLIDSETDENAPVVQTLDRLIREMVKVANEYRVEVTMFWEQYRRLPQSLEQSNFERRRNFYRRIAAIAQRGVDNGELAADVKPLVFAMSIIGVCQHSVHWFVPGRELSMDDFAATVAHIFLSGVVRR